MIHRILSWRDLLWLTMAFSMSGGASGALVTAVVTENRTLLDLPWLVILGSVGLAMFGGLVGTLFVLHAAGLSGERVDVRLQVLTDLGRAAVLGIVAYAVVIVNGWLPEVLLGLLPLLGVGGQKMLDPLLKGVISIISATAERLAGPRRDKE